MGRPLAIAPGHGDGRAGTLAQGYENESSCASRRGRGGRVLAGGASARDTEEARLADALVATALLVLHKNSGDPRSGAAAERVLARLEGAAGPEVGDEAAAVQLAIARGMRARLAGEESAVGVRVPAAAAGARRCPRCPTACAAASRRCPIRASRRCSRAYATLVERLPRAAGDFAWDYGDSPGYAAECCSPRAAATWCARSRRASGRSSRVRHPRGSPRSRSVDALAAAAGDPDPRSRACRGGLARAVASAGWSPAWTATTSIASTPGRAAAARDYGATTLSAQVA
jgi:hypothetical protein